ncbi:hypothetical protein F5X68DRAFT_79633 [Plectosphaerella plurivora]|uniref:Uncharacterized protein n=1 Tax=Plectosphaerella plurivora TaxID=936078 RepID=A0A9P8VEA9_9PEZI|nr:hypothetical protein F5X68DRAFT_79633 [Plectosphaerella plurivora]
MAPNSSLFAGARITSTFFNIMAWLAGVGHCDNHSFFHLPPGNHILSVQTPFSPIYPVVGQPKHLQKRSLEVSHPCGARGANFDTISLFQSGEAVFQHLISTKIPHGKTRCYALAS